MYSMCHLRKGKFAVSQLFYCSCRHIILFVNRLLVQKIVHGFHTQKRCSCYNEQNQEINTVIKKSFKFVSSSPIACLVDSVPSWKTTQIAKHIFRIYVCGLNKYKECLYKSEREEYCRCSSVYIKNINGGIIISTKISMRISIEFFNLLLSIKYLNCAKLTNVFGTDLRKSLRQRIPLNRSVIKTSCKLFCIFLYLKPQFPVTAYGGNVS